MKHQQFEPVLKPVMLNRICRSEYLKAKEKFVKDRKIDIEHMINGNRVSEIVVLYLFKLKFHWQTRQTDRNIIVTVINIYKKLYG